MQLVTFYDGNETINISLAKDAGYAFPLPFMPIVVDILTLTTPADEAVMAIKNTRMELEHLALSVEAGKADLYYRGHKILSASTGAFTVTGFELGEGLHSEHILSPKTARPEDISTWSNMRSPFFDPSPVILDSQIPSAGKWDNKARTFYQATEPEATGIGDIWIKTDAHNHMYRWNGTDWRDAADRSPIDAGQRPITAAGGNVLIDEHGAFGYYNGVQRAGFGTDGRWMAGGGAVTADELGIMIRDLVLKELRLHLGDVGGQAWGSGVLPAGTYGLWGERAGLYLRGYSSLILAQECSDGDIVAVPEDYTLANPSVMITPRDVLIYHPGMTEKVNLITDAIQKSEREWQIVAKLVMRGGANVTEWAPVERSASQRIIDVVVPVGQEADYFICRPSWHIQGAGGNVIFGFGITDDFDSLGNPIEDSYRLVKAFGRDSNGSGMLNWDMPFPHKGRWAVRFSGTGSTTLGVTTGRVGVDRWGWSFGNRYLDNDGNEINADELSGVGVVVQILDQG